MHVIKRMGQYPVQTIEVPKAKMILKNVNGIAEMDNHFVVSFMDAPNPHG